MFGIFREQKPLDDEMLWFKKDKDDALLRQVLDLLDDRDWKYVGSVYLGVHSGALTHRTGLSIITYHNNGSFILSLDDKTVTFAGKSRLESRLRKKVNEVARYLNEESLAEKARLRTDTSEAILQVLTARIEGN